MIIEALREIVAGMRVNGIGIAEATEGGKTVIVGTGDFQPGDWISINCECYVVLSIDGDQFTIEGDVDIAAGEIAWQTLAPYFYSGTFQEISNLVTDKQQGTTTKSQIWPAVLVLEPFDQTGATNYGEYCKANNVKIVFVCQSNWYDRYPERDRNALVELKEKFDFLLARFGVQAISSSWRTAPYWGKLLGANTAQVANHFNDYNSAISSTYDLLVNKGVCFDSNIKC